MKLARESGAEVIGGLDMLVGQASHQFEWWTGHRAPLAALQQAATAFVRRGNGQPS
jgi:shikimate 5-dehydrogenase